MPGGGETGLTGRARRAETGLGRGGGGRGDGDEGQGGKCRAPLTKARESCAGRAPIHAGSSSCATRSRRIGVKCVWSGRRTGRYIDISIYLYISIPRIYTYLYISIHIHVSMGGGVESPPHPALTSCSVPSFLCAFRDSLSNAPLCGPSAPGLT